MKKTIHLLIAMMMLVLCTCSKDEGFVSDSSRQDDLLKKANKGAVFTVLPSGGDDTPAIRDAFDEAKEAGPGSVVRLKEGQYTIWPVEIRDFNGYFQGAGMGKTIISNMPGIPCNDYWAVDNMPYLMQFVGGNIAISDMTFHLNDGCPCDGPQEHADWYGDLLVAVLVLTDYTATYMPDNHSITGLVDHVEFVPGKILTGYNPYGKEGNMNMNLLCGAPYFSGDPATNQLSRGEITVTSCRFFQSTVGPDIAGFDEKSRMRIENNFISDNVVGMYMAANLGSKITLNNNKIQGSMWQDIYIDDYDYGWLPNVKPRKRTEWTISGNDFQSSPGVKCLYLIDSRRMYYPDEGLPQLFDIKGNNFNTQEGGIAIDGLNNVDAKIWNNKFTGTGSVGVWIDGDETTDTWAEKNSLIGNNYFGATYTDAAVYLGPYSMNCKVVGVSTDLVVDEGVNNSVIGTKAQKKGVQAGEYLQNNLKNVHENLLRRGRP